MSFTRRGTTRTAVQRLLARAMFAVPLLGFLILGIVLVGDFSAQWWVLLVPVVLMIGPVLAVRREARTQPTAGGETTPWA